MLKNVYQNHKDSDASECSDNAPGVHRDDASGVNDAMLMTLVEVRPDETSLYLPCED